ncbi:MAG: diguanylate cyclase and metal dependent phosphohydrolase [Planctomycetota bacterium]|nr:MAG: diguanylate cyclase and metal dependent phosphohydrolase [Planctomycetota bacterium]
MISADQLDRAGRAYFRVIPIAGIAVLGWALLDLFLQPPSPAWLALAALTVFTGSFTVKIPGLVARLSVSEPFVFAATLWFGPSVGAVTASLDALIMSLWLLPNLKTLNRVAFNVSVLVIAIWLSSQGFFALSGINPRAPVYKSLADFVVPLYLFTASTFLLNSGLIAVAISFDRKQSAFRVWREQFLWLSLNYFGGASVAAVLVVYAKEMDWAVFGIIVPLLMISYLTFRTTLGRLDDANSHLREVNRLYLSTIETLAMAVDAKDQVTHGHIRRVQRYALGLAKALDLNDDKQIKAIEAAALLHDMGKLAIPEYILNKPGRLTPLEFDKMKLHAGIGADILSSIEFPYPVIPIVRHHHESWDGTGYPDGLRGTAIPLGARILSVVDCFDALTSDRPYRPKLSSSQALQVVIERRGTMYDPVVVDTFAANILRLEEAAVDPGPESPTLKQIAELNNPANLPTLQSPHGASELSHPMIAEADWTAAFSGAIESAHLAPVALGRAAGYMPVTGCAIYVVDGDGACGWVAANRVTSLNSIAALDLDQGVDTHGLLSSVVSPILDAGDNVRGVLAFYSNVLNCFSVSHQTMAEAAARALSSVLPTDIQEPARLDSTPEHLGQLISQVEGSKGWWPVGIVVTRLDPAMDSGHIADQAWQVLRNAVRAEDSLVRIDARAFLMLLLKCSNDTTRAVAARVQAELAAYGAKAVIEWASVDLEPGAENQAFTSLADAIHHTAMEADGRIRRTTH